MPIPCTQVAFAPRIRDQYVSVLICFFPQTPSLSPPKVFDAVRIVCGSRCGASVAPCTYWKVLIRSFDSIFAIFIPQSYSSTSLYLVAYGSFSFSGTMDQVERYEDAHHHRCRSCRAHHHYRRSHRQGVSRYRILRLSVRLMLMFIIFGRDSIQKKNN